MFKKVCLGLLLLSAFTFAAVGSSDKKMAVGGWLQGGNGGEHAGLDFKMRQDDVTSIDIYASFKFTKGDNSLGAYLAYYWNFYNLIPLPPEAGRMGLYVGPAGGLGWWSVDKAFYDDDGDKLYDDNEDGIAVRVGVVGGWEWEFPNPIPLELYVELNPVGEYHYMWYDKHDDETTWQLPDVYLRIGLRFWF